MTEQERKAYVEFMFSEENIRNCKECSENSGHDSWEGKLPCGQQNCWVRLHCKVKR